MRPVALVVFTVLAICGLGMTQSSEKARGPDRVEVFGGYSYMNPDFSLVSGSGVSGWNGSVNFKLRRTIGVVADISRFYPRYTYPPPSGSVTVSGNTYSFLFGPQVSMRVRRVTPFARFLTGVSHVSPQSISGFTFTEFKSNNAWSLAAGGGVDYSVTRRVALRGAVDWLYARFTPIGGGDPGVNYVRNRNVARMSTGVVFRF